MSICEVLPVPANALTRADSVQATLPDGTPSFMFGPLHKSYKHQFANIYYMRLTLLKASVEQKARERWRGLNGSPPLIPRVLDVVKSQLCFIVGTVYIDMLQKPNVLEDVARDRSLPSIPARSKYHSADDTFMLEDESGRVELVGEALRRVIDVVDPEDKAMEGRQSGWGNLLVTGVIMAALGRETAAGAFEVKDVCFAGMAPMMYKTVNIDEAMDIDESETHDNWVGFISGLDLEETSASDFRLQLLMDYLAGEAGGENDQKSATRVSRLIIAGDSLAPISIEKEPSVIEVGLKAKRFGHETSNFSSVPTSILSDFLLSVSQAMPVHLLTGATDPSGTLLPQQPLPRAMFGTVKTYEGFNCETNPVWLGIENEDLGSSAGEAWKRSLLVHSGQSLEDMYKYVPSPPTSRLDLACATLHWRHAAPTAPDTLWCYPYLTADPFVLQRTPDLYVLGCQPHFDTRAGFPRMRAILDLYMISNHFFGCPCYMHVSISHLYAQIAHLEECRTLVRRAFCRHSLPGDIIPARVGTFVPRTSMREKAVSFSDELACRPSSCSRRCSQHVLLRSPVCVEDTTRYIMRFTTAIAAFSLPAFAVAQIYGPAPGPAPGSSSSTSSALPTAPTAPPNTAGFVNINVAFNETFTFNPANVTAPNGTIVTFFFPNAGLDHSVTQSSFADPCTPLAANATSGSPAGFDSGFQAGVQFSINITDDQTPIWFHCKMPLHCGMGMAGSINAPTTGNNTFDAFMAAALAIGANEVTEPTNSPVLSGDGAFATALPSDTATGAGSSNTGSSNTGSSSGAERNVATAGAAVLLGTALSMLFFA
ncbi:hypothetical protein EW145_g4698 [Phellinidium pouzarii]|uniref:Blue (type 1) copper domain-containing protein n=1 Tax=Phellinidium pouzarii TaxID=167371 RepID=A0A4S4L4F5_9AGAM|nr:hypothetical protein EW145_g4698 [Phellinidium pouzarii]